MKWVFEYLEPKNTCILYIKLEEAQVMSQIIAVMAMLY